MAAQALALLLVTGVAIWAPNDHASADRAPGTAERRAITQAAAREIPPF